ncbi:MAG: AarF/UbiB family protein [Candidatus Woesearchaeota archaeon]
MNLADKIKGMRRFNQLVAVLAKYESSYILKKELSIWKKSNITEPQVVRLILEEMGGSFVKLGQLLSLRPDLIPQDYCFELSKLQDSVKPFPFKDAKEIIEKETGKKLNELFSDFNEIPVASASVGQVYKAKLKSGELVAIKVKRPGIDELFEKDIALMEFVANLINDFHGADIINPKDIVSEFKLYTKLELDYMEEAKKIDVFYQFMKNSTVKIPRTYLNLCSRDVLVMEFITGHELKKIIESKDSTKISIDYKKRIAREVFNSFLKQIMVDGVFHADPHPSNIFVLTGQKEKIALLDFGITGVLTPIMRSELVKLFISLNSKDVEGVITSMMHMNMVSENDSEVKADFRNMLGPYYNQGLDKIDFPKLFIQSIKVARKHKIRVPKDYVLLGKAVLTIESVCAQLYSEFNFVEESKPFLTRLMIHEYLPSQFLARKSINMTSAKKLAFEIPSIVSRFFSKDDSKNNERDKKVEELSNHLFRAEHRIDVLMEKLILMFTTFILIVAGLLLIKLGPIFDGVSIFSIVAFCMAAATFFLSVSLRSKKD